MKLNLVLSGGGVRGIAHLGIIKALTEADIEINAISGTSSGAIAGAFIAAGYDAEEAFSIFKKNKLLRLIRGAFSNGLFSLGQIEKLLLKYFPGNAFESLKLPLYISSTDLYSGKTVFFSEGELISPLLASASVPIFFRPVTYRKHLLLDGGLLNNLPVEPFIASRIPTAGIHVNPISEVDSIQSTFRVMERSFQLAVNANVVERMKQCDFVIEPPLLSQYRVFEWSKADDIFWAGCDYAREIIPAMVKQISKR